MREPERHAPEGTIMLITLETKAANMTNLKKIERMLTNGNALSTALHTYKADPSIENYDKLCAALRRWDRS